MFAARPLKGNQLAVFTDARALREEEFQRLARETRLSETTFVLPRNAALEGERGVRVRMIFYNGDDPATGSASGCCAAWMVRYGLVQAGERVMIEQGTECRRASRIYASAARAGDRIVDGRVGGSVVEVARGVYQLP